MKKHINEQAAPAATPAGAAAPGVAPAAADSDKKLGSSGKKLQDRLAKIPGLDKLMSTVTKRDDAAEILAAIAEKLGGDKLAGSKALTDALKLAKEEEKLNEQVSQSVEAFVNYLFESKKEDEEEDKKKKKVSEEEHDERKHEDASVAALEKQLDKIPSGYWKRVNTTDKAVELVIKAVLDRLSFSSPSKHSQLRSKLLSSLRKY